MRAFLPIFVLLTLAACGDRPPAAPRTADTLAVAPLDPSACQADEYVAGLYDRLMHPTRLEPSEVHLVLDGIEYLDDPCYVDSLTAFLERFDGRRVYDERTAVLSRLVKTRSDSAAAWLVANEDHLGDDDWHQIGITAGAERWRAEGIPELLMRKSADPELSARARAELVGAFAFMGTLAEVRALAERLPREPPPLQEEIYDALPRYDYPSLNGALRQALREAEVGQLYSVVMRNIRPYNRYDLLPELRVLRSRLSGLDALYARDMAARLDELIPRLEAESAAESRLGLPLTWPDPPAWPDTTATP